MIIIFKKTTKFKSNVLEAISKIKLKNSKNLFSIPVVYETRFETTCKTSCAVTNRLITLFSKNSFLLLQWNLNTCLGVKFEGVG